MKRTNKVIIKQIHNTLAYMHIYVSIFTNNCIQLRVVSYHTHITERQCKKKQNNSQKQERIKSPQSKQDIVGEKQEETFS